MRIAVLEDEPAQLSLLVDILEHRLLIIDESVSCVPFASGEALRAALRTESFDLLVLDWNVPDLSGVDLLTWLRQQRGSSVPVVMLSARHSERDVVRALGTGADDYMVKPFRPLELVARVERLLKSRPFGAAGVLEHFGNWVFDRLSSSVEIAEPAHRVPLSDSEFRMALALFRNMGRPVSRAHLLECAGRDGETSNRALDSQIYRLRVKLGLHVAHGIQLHTVYGHGYRLEALHGDAYTADGLL
jgi:DNA-binding response OmpR family regulator